LAETCRHDGFGAAHRPEANTSQEHIAFGRYLRSRHDGPEIAHRPGVNPSQENIAFGRYLRKRGGPAGIPRIRQFFNVLRKHATANRRAFLQHRAGLNRAPNPARQAGIIGSTRVGIHEGNGSFETEERHDILLSGRVRSPGTVRREGFRA
jgi:hypothetical protein